MCNSCGKGCTPVVTGPHVTRTKDVHGIEDTSKLETKTGAQVKAQQAAEKALIQAKQYADSILGGSPGGDGGAIWETPEGAQAKVDEHAEKTTDVHGVKDTAKLVTEDKIGPLVDAAVAEALAGSPTPGSGQEAVDEHASRTKDVHGIADTSKLVTKDDLKAAIAAIPAGGGGDGEVWETPEAAQAKADKALDEAKKHVDAHADKTEDVHGIADTAQLTTKDELKAVEDKVDAFGKALLTEEDVQKLIEKALAAQAGPPTVQVGAGKDPNGVTAKVDPPTSSTYAWNDEEAQDVPEGGVIPEKVLPPGEHALKVCTKSASPVCRVEKVTVPLGGSEPEPTAPEPDIAVTVHRNPGDDTGQTVDVYTSNGPDRDGGKVVITWEEGSPGTGVSPGDGRVATTHRYPAGGEKVIAVTGVNDPSRTGRITVKLPLPVEPGDLRVKAVEDRRDETRMTVLVYADNGGAGDVKVDAGGGPAVDVPGTGAYGVVRKFSEKGEYAISATGKADPSRKAEVKVTVPFTDAGPMKP